MTPRHCIVAWSPRSLEQDQKQQLLTFQTKQLEMLNEGGLQASSCVTPMLGRQSRRNGLDGYTDPWRSQLMWSSFLGRVAGTALRTRERIG